MRYTYKAAWLVIGGIDVRNHTAPVELYRSDGLTFVLANDPDMQLADLDHATAVRRLMLKTFIGQRGAEELPAVIAAEIRDLKAERARKVGQQAVLIAEAHGHIDVALTEPYREGDDYAVTFDAFDKQAIARRHRADIEAMKLAVAFESGEPSQFASLGDCTYLINDDGKTIYSLTFSMSAAASVSTQLSSERAMNISTRYGMVKKAGDLESVQRLIGQMADFETDRLKAFVAGWAALEIFVGKTFKTYQAEFLSPMVNAAHPSLRQRFVDRVNQVMKDKYRLTEKFTAVAAVLFPDAAPDELQHDLERFSGLKKLRDSIFHGDEFAENALPVHEIAALTRKYVLAHITASNVAHNCGGI